METFTLINIFSNISNYTINWNKSTILPLSEDAWDSAGLPVHTGNIRYLGTDISPRLSELFHLNYNPLLKTIEDDLQRWMNLPLSLLGRIATVKMKILPHINYLFSMLPIIPTDKWFKSIDSITTHFYWKNKKAKIKLSTLQKNKSQGGLDAPNFYFYYLANQTQYIAKWIHQTNHNNSWSDLEQHYCQNIALLDLPFLNTTIKRHPCFKKTVISTTLTARWKVIRIFKSTPALCKYTPIGHNPDFQLHNNPLHYHHGQKKVSIQYKTIHRTYITQYKMHKTGLVTTDICSQCITETINN